VNGYHYFGVICNLYLQDIKSCPRCGGCRFLQNSGTHQRIHTASHPRRPQCWYSPSWEISSLNKCLPILMVLLPLSRNSEKIQVTGNSEKCTVRSFKIYISRWMSLKFESMRWKNIFVHTGRIRSIYKIFLCIYKSSRNHLKDLQ
jgi:hypothetical protein